MTGLFASRRYDDISYPIEQFWQDAREGKLANVVFVDPNYTDRAEDMGTSNDYHPWGNLLVAEGFLAQVHDALKNSPQWDRMVFVLNFDEHGGFFDHVPPPECKDDTKLAGSGPHPDLKRLGFRVPAIAMGPFAPRKIEKAGPYEHCSVLKMIEWRWGLKPMTMRDRYAKNLAEALDFTQRRDAVALPAYDPPPARACATGGGWLELQVSREGWVKVICDGPVNADCSAKLLALEGELQLAHVPVNTNRPRQQNRVGDETDGRSPRIARSLKSHACRARDDGHRCKWSRVQERLFVDPERSCQPLVTWATVAGMTEAAPCRQRPAARSSISAARHQEAATTAPCVCARNRRGRAP